MTMPSVKEASSVTAQRAEQWVDSLVGLHHEIITPAFESDYPHVNRDLVNANYSEPELDLVRIEARLTSLYNFFQFKTMVDLHIHNIAFISNTSRGRSGFDRKIQVTQISKAVYSDAESDKKSMFDLFRRKR